MYNHRISAKRRLACTSTTAMKSTQTMFLSALRSCLAVPWLSSVFLSQFLRCHPSTDIHTDCYQCSKAFVSACNRCSTGQVLSAWREVANTLRHLLRRPYDWCLEKTSEAVTHKTPGYHYYQPLDSTEPELLQCQRLVRLLRVLEASVGFTDGPTCYF